MTNAQKIFAILLFAGITNVVPAQKVEWHHIAGSDAIDYPGPIVTDLAGNTYVAGTFQGTIQFGQFTLTAQEMPGFSGDIFLVKINPDGSYAWALHAGSYEPTYTDEPATLQIDQDGNVLMAGVFPGGFAFVGDLLNTQSGRGFLTKINPDGETIWLKRYMVEGFASIATDTANNIFIAGSFFQSGQIDTFSFSGTTNAGYCFFGKLDENGAAQWVNKIGNDVNNTFCSSADIAVRPNGTFTLSGGFNNLIFFPNGEFLTPTGPSSNYYLATFDAAGEMLWKEKIQASGYFPAKLALDKADNLLVFGQMWGTVKYKTLQQSNLYPQEFDLFLLKLKMGDGQPLWLKALGGFDRDYPIDIQCDGLGNFIASASTSQPIQADDLTAATRGDIVLQGQPGGTYSALYNVGSDQFASVRHTLATYPGSAWAVTGYYNYPFTFGDVDFPQSSSYDVFMIKVNCPSIELFITKNQNTLSAPSGFASYQWLLDGAAIPGATGQTFEMTQSGTYTVRGISSEGCQHVSGAQSFTVVGTKEAIPQGCVLENALGKTVVDCTGKNFREVLIFNTSGQKIAHSTRVETGRFEVETTLLPAGIYLACGQTLEGEMIRVKFSVSR